MSFINDVAESLIAHGENEKAGILLRDSRGWLPVETFPLDYTSVRQIDLLLELGEEALALEMAESISAQTAAALKKISESNARNIFDMKINLLTLSNLIEVLEKHNIVQLAEICQQYYKEYANLTDERFE